MTLILASSSQFRRNVFRQFFKDHLIQDQSIQFLSPDIDEKAIRNADPERLCQMIAEAKCDAILKNHSKRLPQDAIVITCDQIVVCDGEIREKPTSEEEARRFLKSYSSGSPAICLSGMVVHSVQGDKRVSEMDKSSAKFVAFPDEVIDHLISKREIFTTSGGFTLGDRELAKYVEKSDDLTTIEGLPVQRLNDMIQQVCSSFNATPEKPLAQITHILFDMDGLLLDTESMYTIAQKKLLKPFGVEFTPEVKRLMMGRKALEAVEAMIDHYGLEGKIDPAKFCSDRDAMLQEMFPNSDLMPGALRLLLHLHAHNVPMAIATSSHRRNYDLKTTKHKKLFDRVFQHIVTGDEVTKSKPNPDIYQHAASLFKNQDNLDPGKVLVFEDAILGVEAGNRADMPVVWVFDNQEEDLIEKTENAFCASKIPTLMHFNPTLFGLPEF